MGGYEMRRLLFAGFWNGSGVIWNVSYWPRYHKLRVESEQQYLSYRGFRKRNRSIRVKIPIWNRFCLPSVRHPCSLAFLTAPESPQTHSKPPPNNSTHSKPPQSLRILAKSVWSVPNWKLHQQFLSEICSSSSKVKSFSSNCRVKSFCAVPKLNPFEQFQSQIFFQQLQSEIIRMSSIMKSCWAVPQWTCFKQF